MMEIILLIGSMALVGVSGVNMWWANENAKKYISNRVYLTGKCLVAISGLMFVVCVIRLIGLIVC